MIPFSITVYFHTDIVDNAITKNEEKSLIWNRQTLEQASFIY